MSDISSSSYCRDNKCDNKCDNNGFSPMLLILLLLLCQGDGGIFGGKGDCGGGCNSGLDGILPLILLLSLGGGCF